jgi:creatinine amidohydrolase/Fe(II)-dependent formamide hydrolase-like protein
LTQLGTLTSAEAAERAAAGAVLVVPVGSTEQHGPHLPLSTDAVHGVSPNGVLGDPAGASASEGTDMFRTLLADLAAFLKRWPDARP